MMISATTLLDVAIDLAAVNKNILIHFLYYLLIPNVILKYSSFTTFINIVLYTITSNIICN